MSKYWNCPTCMCPNSWRQYACSECGTPQPERDPEEVVRVVEDLVYEQEEE